MGISFHWTAVPLPRLALGLVVLLLGGAASGALAAPFWSFGPDAEQELQEARLARQRLDFAGAVKLLDAALRSDPHLEAPVLHERGLVARDRGDQEHALSMLARAADLDGGLPARVDQAGILVQLGRWPEAVTILRQAFEERGPSLPMDQIVADRRFVRLATLKPYQDLMLQVKLEQAGPMGRVLVRLERLQGSVSAAEHGWQRLAAWFALLKGLAASQAAAVLLLLALGACFTFALGQLAILQPPWTLFAGLLAADLTWVLAVRHLSEGASWGAGTLARGNGALLLLYGSMRLLRLVWWRMRLARLGSADPFAAEHLPDTLLRVDEVSRLGHRLIGSRQRDQRVLAEALRQAGDSLRERLEKGVLP